MSRETLAKKGSKFALDEHRFGYKVDSTPSAATYKVGGFDKIEAHAPEYTMKGRIAIGDKLFE